VAAAPYPSASEFPATSRPSPPATPEGGAFAGRVVYTRIQSVQNAGARIDPMATVPISPMTERLAAYVAGAAGMDLPEAVVAKAIDHVTDSIAAILSGTELRAGRLAIA